MADTDTTAPDLNTVGAQPDPMDATSLLRALSQGPMQQAQANPDFQNWAGLAGFGFGMQGQSNPVVNQLLAAQEADRRQKMATFQVMADVQRQREHKQKSQVDLLKTFLDSPDPEARQWSYRQMLEIGRQQGLLKDIPPGLDLRLAARHPSKDEGALILGEILSTIPMPETLRRHPNVTQADYQGYWVPIAQNGPALKHFGYDDPQKLVQSLAEHELKVHKARLDELGLGGEGVIPNAARNYISVRFQKKPWEATPEEAAAALENATAPLRKREAEMSKAREATLRRATEALKGMGSKASMAEFKMFVEPLNKQVAALSSLRTMNDLVDKLPNLPKAGATWGQMEMKRWQRAWQNPTDPNLFTFKQLVGPIFVGQVDRGVYDEKSVRAIQAFQKQLEVGDKPPSREALHQYIQTVIEAIRGSGRLKIQQTQMMPLSPEIAGIIQTMIAPALTEPTTADDPFQDYLK